VVTAVPGISDTDKRRFGPETAVVIRWCKNIDFMVALDYGYDSMVTDMVIDVSVVITILQMGLALR
jgi:hypothetical protein